MGVYAEPIRLCGAFQDANYLLHLYQLKGSLAQSWIGETAAYCWFTAVEWAAKIEAFLRIDETLLLFVNVGLNIYTEGRAACEAAATLHHCIPAIVERRPSWSVLHFYHNVTAEVRERINIGTFFFFTTRCSYTEHTGPLTFITFLIISCLWIMIYICILNKSMNIYFIVSGFDV